MPTQLVGHSLWLRPYLRGSIVVWRMVMARVGMRSVTIPGVWCDWLLVDGSSLTFRAFYGARRRVKDAGALRDSRGWRVAVALGCSDRRARSGTYRGGGRC